MRLRVLRGERPPGGAEAAPGPSGPTPPWRRLLRVPTPRSILAALRRNTGLKLVSLLLAFLLWFSINVSERDAEGTIELPVRVRTIAPGLIVTSQPAKPVAVTVRGPRTILDGIDERRERLTLDLTDVAPGEERVKLNAETMIRPGLPRRLKIIRLEPSSVRVRIERLVHRRLPVKPELSGTPPLSYTAGASVAPGEVDVSGPASKVDDLKEIKTETVELHGTPDPIQRTVLLQWAGDFVSFTPDRVTVAITFAPTMMSRKFEHVEVTVRNVPAGLHMRLTPLRVDLTVQGPQKLLASYTLPDGSVWVDAAGLDPGVHRVTPHVELPQSLEVVRREPEVHTLELTSNRTASIR